MYCNVCMYIYPTVAKEASDIVILDDNFASIVKAVVWGRSVFDNIRRFLQFQLTVNVVALTITFVSAVTGFAPPLNAVMMLWVNLIMDTLGALALGTEAPSDELLERLPYKRNASLISLVMIRNIGFQSIFQIGLLAYVLILGAVDFETVYGSQQHFTIVFNVFVYCQIFNEFNARSIGHDVNVFKGLGKNVIFLCIFVFTNIAQYCLVTYGGDFVKTEPLTHMQWYRTILIASLTLPLGGVMRFIPISENPLDFAVVAKGSSKRTLKRSKTELAESITSKSSGVSLYVWYITVTVITALVYKEFHVMWMQQLIDNGVLQALEAWRGVK